MLNIIRFMIKLSFLAYVTFIHLEKTHAQIIITDEKEGSGLILNRYTTQKEVDEIELRSDLSLIKIEHVSINSMPIFKRQLPTVKELRITGVPFLDQIVKTISEKTPELEVLNLSGSGIISDSLLGLSKLSKLRVLDLSDTHLTKQEHLDHLLESNEHLVIYIESLLDEPFSSINLAPYKDNVRVMQKKYPHS